MPNTRSEWLDILLKKHYLLSEIGPIEYDGVQQIDGKWWIPLWGCDTLDHLLDDIDYAFNKALSEEIKQCAKLCEELPTDERGPWFNEDMSLGAYECAKHIRETYKGFINARRRR